MNAETSYDDINASKENMDHIYNQADPHAYFRELKKLDYAIPEAAKPVFQKLIRHLRRRRGDTVHVLDLGCSYGVNAALLKHCDLSLTDLYRHWGAERPAERSHRERVHEDRGFFENLEPCEDIEVIGLDQADRAVAFAEDVGLLDEGLAVNLEAESLPAQACDTLSSVDLVTSTGCVGYVSEKSFARLLPAVVRGRAPWIANFVLRMFPFDAIEEKLAAWGYVTERLEGRTFFQRRFACETERDRALECMRARGVAPLPEEKEGHLFAEFYLSRPAEEAAQIPIEGVLLA